MGETFCKDDFWDSELSWRESEPDFTFCFKQTVLVWTPCGFLWLFSLLDLMRRRNSRYRDIPWSFLNVTKSITLFLLICVMFFDMSMLFSVRQEEPIYDVQIVSIFVKIATLLYVAFLQQFHKIKGHRSSGLLFTFWVIFTFCSIPQLRWEVINFNTGNFDGENISWAGIRFIIYVTFFSLISIMTILNFFSDKPPRHSSYPKATNPNPEISSSMANRAFFLFFDPTAWRGWRRPLEERDIYDINPENASSELVPEFDKHFKASVEKQKRKHEKSLRSKSPTAETTKPLVSIFPAMVKTFAGHFFFSAIFKFFVDMLQFASPLLLGALIIFVEAESALWKGLLLAFTLFLVTFLIALLNGQHGLTSYQVGFRIRTALISSIYRKALKISSRAKRNTTVGEIVNLMAVDAHRFFEMIPYLHILWSGPIVMSLAIFLLWTYLNVAVFSGLAVMIALIPLSGFIATKLRNLQTHQMRIKDERVKSTNEILSGMKVLKLYAWEPSFEDLICDIREGELVFLRKAAIYNAATEFIWSLAPFMVALFSFMTFVFLGNRLTPEIAFVSMALFNILRMPMTLFPMTINFVMIAYVSVKRLSNFMNMEELDANNVTNNPSLNALEIQDGTFSWGDDIPTLKNINMTVKKNNLSSVVGPVGCGKTSLISALLGEMEKNRGSVNVDGKIAYVAQQAWIQNATLQDNITFGRPFNKRFYQQVINACALTSDIAMLPGGDQTEIGEKGINLSGGQKQRVSIARAVYSGADIFIFDDPLSAVDSHVGKHIFDNVLGENGILNGKTRFLVTHAISFLPKVDEIFVMSNGEISESGSYKQLMAQKGAFSEFLIQYLQEHNNEEDLKEIEDLVDDADLRLMLQRQTSVLSQRDRGSSGSLRRRSSRRSSTQSEVKEMKKPALAKLIESEDSQTGSVDLGIYLTYFKSIGIPFSIVILLFNAINQSMSVLSNFWLSRWSTDDRAHEETFWRNVYVGVYGSLGLVQGIALLIGAVFFAIGAIRSARNLHKGLLHNTLRLPMSFFDTTPLGRIMNRFSKDTDVIDALLPQMMRNWIWMFFSVVAIFIVISISTPIFMSVAVPIIIIYYFIQKFYVATSRQLKRLESVTRSPIYSHFSESIGGQSTIRAYGENKRFTVDSETKVDHNQSISYMSICANRWLGVRLEIVGSIVVLAASLFAVLARETIDSSIVGLSISYALQISSLMSFFVRMTTEVETNIVAVERVVEYSKRPQEAAWKTVDVNPEWPQKGVVEFKNFQVRYREGLDLVLKGIDFITKSQEKIGIVGRTGAGKSSLTLALFRIIEAAGGKISIDDIDVASIGLHSLRSRLTIIPQDPVLFSGSLRMNIDPFNSYPDDAIWTALEHSHMKTYVKGLSDGLQYKITEGGENLSVGQRQLVCLARALLRKTKVLILDEATAAIDIETDELIQKTIREQFNECTILTIAHRLNTIMDSDKIIVLDQGLIAEFDTPANLLANKNSIFYGMAESAGLVGDDNQNDDFDERKEESTDT
ncbi:CLUMA_CG015851, isoform A [Clunio marinus]|uniref:ABC-type glutathione-S-conjugate transporter n=1 Tax=Clunio marinus TaxID=568069 RepID=A0A1J1IRT7_9DIPT|nr:CLUMA_CG015851, isoform A [Clunio marinus]